MVERRLAIVTASQDLLAHAGFLLRGDVAARRREGLVQNVEVLSGTSPESVVAREGPVRCRAGLRGSWKAGGFLDQRENHLAARCA